MTAVIKDDLRSLTENQNNLKETVNNNLKYLLNLDRNIRKKNIMIFGLPEKEDLDMGDSLATDDTKDCINFSLCGYGS